MQARPPEQRTLFLQLHEAGLPRREILARINEQWPDCPVTKNVLAGWLYRSKPGYNWRRVEVPIEQVQVAEDPPVEAVSAEPVVEQASCEAAATDETVDTVSEIDPLTALFAQAVPLGTPTSLVNATGCRFVLDERGPNGLALVCNHPTVSVVYENIKRRSSWCLDHHKAVIDATVVYVRGRPQVITPNLQV